MFFIIEKTVVGALISIRILHWLLLLNQGAEYEGPVWRETNMFEYVRPGMRMCTRMGLRLCIAVRAYILIDT